MVDNWLPSFDMNEQKKIDKKIPQQLELILADLSSRKDQISEVTEQDRMAHQQFLSFTSQMPAKAIQLNMPEKNPSARYRNEHISLQEIIASNCQQKERQVR